MAAPVTIAYAGKHRIDVSPGRALRFGDGGYPLFKPPAPEAVAAPDDCLAFLRRLHLSLLGVFDVAARRWLESYFDAVISAVDARSEALSVPAGAVDEDNAHRVWGYAAFRPLTDASGPDVAAPIMFWLDGGPLPVDPRAGPDVPPPLLDFLDGVAAPHHPFVKRPLAGLQISSERQ